VRQRMNIVRETLNVFAGIFDATANGIDLAIAPEKANGPLFLLKGLDRGMEAWSKIRSKRR